MGTQLSAWTVGGSGKEHNTQSRVYSAKIDAMEEQRRRHVCHVYA